MESFDEESIVAYTSAGTLIIRGNGLHIEKLSLDLPQIKEYEPFADENEIADYAKEHIITLYKAGIVDGIGDGLFDPTGFANRASAAKILYETLKTQWDKE